MWKLSTVKLWGDFGHLLALLSLGFPMLQQEDRIVKCLRLPLSLPFWASGVLKYPDLKEGAPELSVGLIKPLLRWHCSSTSPSSQCRFFLLPSTGIGSPKYFLVNSVHVQSLYPRGSNLRQSLTEAMVIAGAVS